MNQPFKARFNLASPIVAADGIRLDALIMKYYLQEIGWTDETIPEHETWRHVDLPLEKIHFGDGFYYAASHGIWENQVIFKDRFFKRINTGLILGSDINNVNTGSGKYCRAVKEYEDIEVKFVDFYGCGDLAICEKLLKKVTAVGGLRKNGKGMVDSFEFISIPDDYSISMNGVLTRDVPVEKRDVGKYLQQMRAGQSMTLHLKQTRIVPPYHYRVKEDKQMCLGVGSLVGGGL